MGIKKQLSIIIPTYNESFNLIKLIKKINFYNSLYFKGKIEILIIDDTDNFSVRQIVQSCENVKYIRNKNKGLLNSIYTGFLNSKYNLVSFMDADLSHNPKYLFLNIKYLENYDLINFSRFLVKGNDKRKLQISGPLKIYSNIINILCKFFISNKITDYTCGFNIFKKNKVNKSFFLGSYGEFYIYFLNKCLKNKLRIKESNIIFVDRKEGSSKTGSDNLSIIKKGKNYLFTIFKIKINVKF